MNQDQNETILDRNLENLTNQSTSSEEEPKASPSFPWTGLLFLLLGFARISEGHTILGSIMLIYGLGRLGYYVYDSGRN